MRTLMILTMACALPASAQLDNGLVGFWPLNLDFNDASNSGLHGIASNAGAYPTDSRSGSGSCAYRMVEGGFHTAESSLLEVSPTGGLTISVWMRQSQPDSYGRVMLQPAGPSLPILLSTWYDGRPSFGLYNSEITADSTQITWDMGWHHITGVYDDHQWFLYYDANLIQQDITSNNAAYGGPASLIVGGAWNTDFDDLRVYDRALNHVEVGLLLEEVPDCELASAVQEAEYDGITLGPNPTSGEFTLTAVEPMAGGRVEVFDGTGRLVLDAPFNGRSCVVDLSGQADGVYQVQVAKVGERRTYRLVKN